MRQRSRRDFATWRRRRKKAGLPNGDDQMSSGWLRDGAASQLLADFRYSMPGAGRNDRLDQSVKMGWECVF